jgi:pyruvate-formate lyase-activating enzyme
MTEATTVHAQPQYGFHGRLRSEFPSQVIADTIEVCNLACVHCSHPEFKKSEYYRARRLGPELNRKMVDEVREFGRGITHYIRYTAKGEPLLNRHIYDMLAYAVAHSGTTVTLTTNGTLLDADRINRLIETGVHLVDISLDAFRPETYARIRVGGDLEITRENVRRLIERARVSSAATKVVVSFIEQPENAEEIPEFERFWRVEGAHQVVVRRLHTNACSTTRLVPLLAQCRHAEKRRPCLYPWERILLIPSGHLAFCPGDWVDGSLLTDYATTTIRETWQSDAYRRLREAHLTNIFSVHKFCAQCPDWATTRWPGQGLSYADLVQTVKVPTS